MTPSAKNRLNDLISEVVFKGSPPATTNYSRNPAHMQLAVDEVLATKGFRFHARDTNGNPVLLDSPDIQRVRLARGFRQTITRSPEHQARVEARGDVAAGMNTYPGRKVNILREGMAFARFRDPLVATEATPGPKIDEPLFLVGHILLIAMTYPDRPVDRLSDEEIPPDGVW